MSSKKNITALGLNKTSMEFDKTKEHDAEYLKVWYQYRADNSPCEKVRKHYLKAIKRLNRVENIPDDECDEVELIEKVRVLQGYVDDYEFRLRHSETALYMLRNPPIKA